MNADHYGQPRIFGCQGHQNDAKAPKMMPTAACRFLLLVFSVPSLCLLCFSVCDIEISLLFALNSYPQEETRLVCPLAPPCFSCGPAR